MGRLAPGASDDEPMPTDLYDRLDRALLERDEAPSHAHAARLLRKKHVLVRKIVATRPEAILYLGFGGAPWTAWLKVRNRGVAGDRLEVRYQKGFPAEPEPDLTVVHTFDPKEF